MPYALTNFEHGQPPSAHTIRRPEDAPAGAMVLSDLEYSERMDWIWDAEGRVLRARTATERLAQSKRRRDWDMTRMLNKEVSRIMQPSEAIAVMLANPNDPRLTQIRNLHGKLERARTAIQNAANENAIENIRWENL